MIQRPAHKRGLGRFLDNQTGMAAVEFALIVPVLLLAYLGATDITQALAIDRKLGQVASTVSDLVAQESEIDGEKVEAFFQSGGAIMRPFDFEKTKLRLTIIEVGEDSNTTRITGAKHRNWPAEIDIGDLPADMLELAEGRYLVVAHASYDYEPLFGTIFDASMPLAQRSMHVVRLEVEDFGFAANGAAPAVPEEETGETGENSGDEDNCAGNSGGHGQGANCDNGNNSHDDDEDRCFGYNCDRDDDDRGGGWGGGGHGGGGRGGGGWGRH